MARGSILSRKNRDGTTTFSIKYRVSGRQVKKAIVPSRREAERALTAALPRSTAARSARQARRPSSRPPSAGSSASSP